MIYFFGNRIARSLYGKDRADADSAFQFVAGLVVVIPGMLGVIGYICYWVYRELSLESRYRQKYGAAWQAEFERYHGSLSHAHLQIAVCGFSMLALLVVVFFACRIFCKPKPKRHDHVVK